MQRHSDLLAGFDIRGDGGAYGDTPVFGDFAGHKADAAHVDVAVFFGKTQLAGQVVAHDITV